MALDKRRAFIDGINDVLVNADDTVENILKRLGWSKEHLLNKTKSAICPFDHGHKMPASSLKQHAETCSWIKDGYTKEEKQKAVPSSKFFYENATTVVTVMIDKELQNHILRSRNQPFDTSLAAQSQLQDKNVPHTMDRAMSELTSEERFAIYDYAIAQGKAANVQNIFQLEDLHLMLNRKYDAPEKEKSQLEIMAELRDYKRRRQSYRAKNVHITKKSYTEVMRNLIDNQMQILNSADQNESNSNHASSGSSPPHEIKLERKDDDTKYISYTSNKHSQDRSPEYERSQHKRPRELERSVKKADHDFSASSESYKRRRSHSRDKHSRSRSSKRDRDHHHHSRESSRTHKKSHKKHKHSHHRRSSED